MSAGSSTQPGGYTANTQQLDQFGISDERDIQEVTRMIQAQGYQAVFKDWEGSWRRPAGSGSEVSPRIV